MKALLLALALLYCDSAWAARSLFQARCEDALAKGKVTLTTRQNGYTVDNTRSFRVLTALKGNAVANAYVLGLTRAQSSMQINSGGPMLQDRLSGYECLAPKIEVQLSYTPITIFVSSEFRPGSCAYQEILAHEMRHLKAYLDHLPKVELIARKALSKRFDNKPLYARRGEGGAALQREIDSGWLPWLKREMVKVEAEQAIIDAPQEYMRLSRICKGEVQSIIGPATGTKRQK